MILVRDKAGKIISILETADPNVAFEQFEKVKIKHHADKTKTVQLAKVIQS